MSLDVLDKSIGNGLKERLLKLEKEFSADVISYFGDIHPSYEKVFRDFIEGIKKEKEKKNRLVIILNTPGGSVETTEKLVKITRFHYNEIYFIIPDYAFSAGTIWCMSGDKIYMDYSSSLGPIDPQVYNGKYYVPALNYLDKVEEFIEKSSKGELTEAEFLMLRELDLAMLKSYEQAKNLTISLLKEWLVKYKFKDWVIHRTNPGKKGKPVTNTEKEERAEEIAKLLNDRGIWHSHGRAIDINCLKDLLRLDIENYSENVVLRDLIREYNDMLTGYILRINVKFFLHSRIHFF